MTDTEFVPDHTHATAHRVKQLQQLLTEARAEVAEWRHLWHEATEVARERAEQIAELQRVVVILRQVLGYDVAGSR